jgi:RNA polymerase sigma factor (sigma-70 family)
MTALNNDLIYSLRQQDINKPVKFLYDNYFDSVVALVQINGGSEDDAADIFQETVMVLIDKVKTGQFRGDSSIKTFMIAIARNLWLQELRSRNRRDARENKFGTAAPTAEDGEMRLFSKENNKVMDVIFEAVGDVCTKILVGFYYEELSMRELLEKFNYENEQVLRNRKSKCMKKVKELFTDKPDLTQQLKNLVFYGK